MLKDIIISGISYGSSVSLSISNIEILSVNTWTMHAEVASIYHNTFNNIFLVGDAAHRFPPAGGFGMNTGLQDVHNLAWKLSMVLSGRADSSLLKTYNAGIYCMSVVITLHLLNC